jgi:hypothetical protein
MVPHVGKKVITRRAVFTAMPQVVMLEWVVVEVVELAVGAIVQ